MVRHPCNSHLSQSLERVQNLDMRAILAKPHVHQAPPSETSSDGPLSTSSTTTQCYVKSTGVCSSKLQVIYVKHLLRTHVPIHPLGELINSTFHNHTQTYWSFFEYKVLWNTINSCREFKYIKLTILQACNIEFIINSIN